MKYQSPVTNLPDEHMRMVGIISTHWEWIEMVLERSVAEVQQIEWSRIRLLTSCMSSTEKIDFLTLYARQAFEAGEGEPDPQMAKWNAVVDKINKARTARNKYIHAKWKPTDADPLRTEVRFKHGKLSPLEEPAPISDLNDAQKIFEAGQALTVFLNAYGLLHDSFLGKPAQ